jgi:hypothetical protein
MVSNLVTSNVALDTLSFPYFSTSSWSFSSLRPVTTTLASDLSTIASARALPKYGIQYQRERDSSMSSLAASPIPDVAPMISTLLYGNGMILQYFPGWLSLATCKYDLHGTYIELLILLDTMVQPGRSQRHDDIRIGMT